jgi:hypothetical protein
MSGQVGPKFIIIQDGLVVHLNTLFNKSYSGTGNIWYDLTRYNNNGTLAGTGIEYLDTPNKRLIINNNTFSNGISLIGNTYTYPTNFTWQIWHYYRDESQSFSGLFWSELALGVNKNFLMAYQSVSTTTPYARIDSGISSADSTAINASIYNGGFNSTLVGRWEFTTIVKNGGTLSWYWGSSLKWSIYFGGGWVIGWPNQNLFIGNRNDFQFPSKMDIASVFMYNKALSGDEIAYNYNNSKSRFGI